MNSPLHPFYRCPALWLVIFIGANGIDAANANNDIVIDTTPPLVSSITGGTTNLSSTTNSFIQWIRFTEPVTGFNLADFEVIKTGTANYDYVIMFWPNTPLGSGVAKEFSIIYMGFKGTGTLTPVLKATGTGISDLAGNLLPDGGAVGGTFVIDRDAPKITQVIIPNPYTFKNGENIDITVVFNEAVKVTGTPSITINLDHGGPLRAVFDSGNDSNALTFRSTISPGQADITGISINRAIEMNGGSIADPAGNVAPTTLANIPDTSRVLVDSIAPVVSNPIPDQKMLTGDPARVIDLRQHFTDLGSSSLQFVVTTNSDSTKASTSVTGNNLTLGALANGVTVITVMADDLHGGTVTDTFEVAIGSADPTAVQPASAATLNSQTGLFQMTVNVTNTTPRPINGFRMHVDFSGYLAAHPSLRLYNATSTTAPGIAYVDVPFPAAVDAVTAVNLTFYTSTRRFPNPFTPDLRIETLASSQLPDTNGSGVQPRMVNLPDGNKLIEFPSETGKWYRVRYSADLVNWQDSPVPLQAGSTRMQWIDSGPPFTESPPSSAPVRFYIVNEITAP